MSGQTYDSLDAHLSPDVDIALAATPMGMLLAWCVSMQLVSNEFQRAHEQEILRVRMQELKGSELLVSSGGDLRADMFNSEGRQFLDHYYPRYLADYQATFGSLYEVKDDWASYSKIAKVLTSHYMQKGKVKRATRDWKLKMPSWLSWKRH